MKNEKKISVIIITKNEENKLRECLESLDGFASEIIVVDTGSVDNTKKIAKEYKAKIYDYPKGGFSDWRNKGLKEAKSDWIFYLDADERITPLLKQEIKSLSENVPYSAYAIPRRNFILGKEMKHGGWWPDYVKRFYKKDSLIKWEGKLHEEPVINGELGHLKQPLIHIKHDNISEMIEKTNEWSNIEAELLLKSNHPKMVWWRFLRIIFTEAYYRIIKLKGYKDGAEGIIYGLYQSWSRFMSYAKLWEMQHKQ